MMDHLTESDLIGHIAKLPEGDLRELLLGLLFSLRRERRLPAAVYGGEFPDPAESRELRELRRQRENARTRRRYARKRSAAA